MTDQTPASGATVPSLSAQGTEPTLFHGSYAIPEGYSRGAANAFLRFQLTQPLAWIQIIIGVVAVSIIIGVLNKGPYDVFYIIGGVIIVLAAIFISLWSSRNGLMRRLKATEVPGAIYELTLTESTIAIRVPGASSTNGYRNYQSAVESGAFVLLRIRGSRIRSILPRQLFTDESLAFVRSKVLG